MDINLPIKYIKTATSSLEISDQLTSWTFILKHLLRTRLKHTKKNLTLP